MLFSGKTVCGERSALATRAATWKGELEGEAVKCSCSR